MRARAPIRSKASIVFLSVVVSGPSPIVAAEWVSHGPPSAISSASLVVDPERVGTVYTSGPQGLFKSADGGQTWTSIVVTGEPASPLGAGPAATLYAEKTVFDAPGSLFYTSTVYKSTDDGGTWNELFEGLWVSYSLVLSPKTPTALFRISTIFSGDFHFPSYRGALDRSVDGGITWTANDAGLELGIITALALDPQSPATMYLATQSGGAPFGGTPAAPAMYESTDGGVHWSELENAPSNVSTIVVLPGALIVASTEGVFRSTDAGETFTLINSELNVENRVPETMIADPLDASRLFAAHVLLGVLESSDGGSTWTPINDGLTGSALAVTALGIDSAGGRLYATTEAPGVFTYPLRLPREPLDHLPRRPPTPVVLPQRPSAVN